MSDSGSFRRLSKSSKNGKCKKRTQIESRTSHTPPINIPLIIPSEALLSHTNQPQTTQPIQPQPQPQSTQPQPQPQSTQSQPIQPQPQSTQSQPIQPQPQPQSTHSQSQPQTPVSSSSHVESNNVNKIMILPEGDGFDKHKLVVSTIGSFICKKLDEAKPSWKKLSKHQRDMWFDMFKDKFTWPPQYNDMVRRNFDKRGAAKFSQLMQDARKDLDRKQDWMGDSIWPQLKEHWASNEFKKKSDTNKRNRESMAGASLHTGGSIPHRQHWNKMREEYGRDPELVDFYFRTHRKKDQSWVGPHAESAYEKFEQRKAELSSQSSSSALGEDNGDASQQPAVMPSDIDIWVDAVGRKKGRIFGLGSIGRTLIPASGQSITTTVDVDAIRSQVHALNESLQREQREKLEMRKELTKTQQQLAALMQHLGFHGSSSQQPPSPQQSNRDEDEDEDEDDDDEEEEEEEE